MIIVVVTVGWLTSTTQDTLSGFEFLLFGCLGRHITVGKDNWIASFLRLVWFAHGFGTSST